MKKQSLLLSLFITFASFSFAQTRSLFNFKDFTGWHIDVPDMDKDPNVKSPFIIRNGMMVSLASPQGHIITDAVYENYRLQVEYRFPAKPGNCGVLVHASSPRVLWHVSKIHRSSIDA